MKHWVYVKLITIIYKYALIHEMWLNLNILIIYFEVELNICINYNKQCMLYQHLVYGKDYNYAGKQCFKQFERRT
jgi:hypothetical protein